MSIGQSTASCKDLRMEWTNIVDIQLTHIIFQIIYTITFFSQNCNSIQRQIYMKILHNPLLLKEKKKHTNCKCSFTKNDHHFVVNRQKGKQWRTGTVQGSDYTITSEFCSRTICQEQLDIIVLLTN